MKLKIQGKSHPMRTSDRIAWSLAVLLCLFATTIAMGRYLQGGMTELWPAVTFYGSAALTVACSIAGIVATARAVKEKQRREAEEARDDD